MGSGISQKTRARPERQRGHGNNQRLRFTDSVVRKDKKQNSATTEGLHLLACLENSTVFLRPPREKRGKARMRWRNWIVCQSARCVSHVSIGVFKINCHIKSIIYTSDYTDVSVIETDPQLTELSSCVTQVERPPPPGSTFSPDRMAISASQGYCC